MKILYGTSEKNIDVTEICFKKLLLDNILCIPSGDANRAFYFTDPLYGILKEIFIVTEHGSMNYDDTKSIFYDLSNGQIHTNISDYIKNTVENKLKNIQNSLKLDFGSFNEEFPEQMMAVRYLTGNEKVLEIGGNIGRNTLVICYTLKNQQHLVSLESDTDISNQLIHNKNMNRMNFFVENSALSKRRLFQIGWDTIPSDVFIEGYKEVNTITWEQLNNKYNIEFDTLVLDCEGAFYYILMDMPEILNNIKLIIMENDYHDITKKEYVDSILIEKSFELYYKEAGGWGPCYNNFFEVWKKTI